MSVTDKAKTRVSHRLLVYIVLIGLLGSLFISAGTLTYAPVNNNFASADEWSSVPEQYVGERISANGIVVSDDPLVIAVEYGIDGERQLTVRNSDTDPDVGQEFGVFGTLTETDTIDAERTHHRDRWEATYMYAISALGVLWVLVRLARTWTINRAQWAFVPRGDDSDA